MQVRLEQSQKHEERPRITIKAIMSSILPEINLSEPFS